VTVVYFIAALALVLLVLYVLLFEIPRSWRYYKLANKPQRPGYIPISRQHTRDRLPK
jgi:hypothetical protein